MSPELLWKYDGIKTIITIGFKFLSSGSILLLIMIFLGFLGKPGLVIISFICVDHKVSLNLQFFILISFE